MKPAFQGYGMIALAAVLGVVVHARSLDAGFCYDDFPYIVENADLRGGWDGLGMLWNESFPSQAPERGLYRPLTATTLLADATVFASSTSRDRDSTAPTTASARPFHRTNLFVYALTILAAGAVYLQCLPFGAAGWATCLFAVHPTHVEAVAWNTGRAELLACAMTCLALALVLRSRKSNFPGAWILVAGIGALAVFSKENGAVAPLLGTAMVIAWKRAGIPSGEIRRSIPSLLALGFGVALALAQRQRVLGSFGPWPGERVFEGTMMDRLPLILAATGEHIRLLVIPWPLSLEHMPFPPQTWSDPRVAWGVVWIAVLLLLLIRTWGGLRKWPKEELPAFIFLGWIPLALLPVMNIIPIGEAVAERFLLLPSVGWAGVLAWGLTGRRDGGMTRGEGPAPSKPQEVPQTGGERAWRTPWRGAGTVVTMLLVALGAVGSFARTEVWRSEERLWRAETRRNPTSPGGFAGLGDAERRRGRFVEAADAYRRALALAPDLTVARLNLAQSLDALGRGAEAVRECEEAVSRDPTHAVALNHLGARLARAGETERALRLFEEAAKAAPRYASAWLNAALAACTLGDIDRAARSLEQTRRLDPENPGLVGVEAKIRETRSARSGVQRGSVP